jgi:hypothetical protein
MFTHQAINSIHHHQHVLIINNSKHNQEFLNMSLGFKHNSRTCAAWLGIHTHSINIQANPTLNTQQHSIHVLLQATDQTNIQ